MYVILDGKTSKKAQDVPNVAYFYQQHDPQPLYIYELANVLGDESLWSFSLRSWNTTQSSIPLDFYPTLQSIDINTSANSSNINGTCTIPNSATDPQTTTSPCLSGTFALGKNTELSLNLTASHLLNNTFSGETGSAPPSTIMLRTQDGVWAHGNNSPALRLREVNSSSGALDGEVLRTTVTKPRHCTELKVCLAGGASGSPVDAEVLAPLGYIFIEQVGQAAGCKIFG